MAARAAVFRLSVNEIMRAYGGNMESSGNEGEGSRIIPGAAYRVTL